MGPPTGIRHPVKLCEKQTRSGIEPRDTLLNFVNKKHDRESNMGPNRDSNPVPKGLIGNRTQGHPVKLCEKTNSNGNRTWDPQPGFEPRAKRLDRESNPGTPC